MPSLFNHENDNEKPIADETDKRGENEKRVNDEHEKTDKRSENDERVEGENKLRVRKETLKMITNTFEPKEMLPFSQLRTLNQKDLLHSLEENDKLGIVIKDQLKVAMIDMEKYQMMVEALQDYERLLNLVEERELYERIGHRLESNNVVEYKEGMSLLEMVGVHLGR